MTPEKKAFIKRLIAFVLCMAIVALPVTPLGKRLMESVAESTSEYYQEDVGAEEYTEQPDGGYKVKYTADDAAAAPFGTSKSDEEYTNGIDYGIDPLYSGKNEHAVGDGGKEEVVDSEGRLLVPFDLAYPEAFEEMADGYCKDHVLIKMKKGFSGSVTSQLSAAGVASLEALFNAGKGEWWYKAMLKDGADAIKSVAALRELEDVIVAEYDYTYETEAFGDGMPTVDIVQFNGKVHQNPYLKYQWNLDSCSVQEAWRFLEQNGSQAGGSSSVVVAVIDTGVDYTHPDLAANMWVNRAEIPNNGIDDDGNGYVDDIHGADVIANDGDPMDDHGHGTYVAGIIGAANNREGIVGVAYNCKIMAVKAGQATGFFNQSDIAEAIIYAYENGAEVINMSFSGKAISIATQDALEVAYTAATLVAAAGNGRFDNEIIPFYPASLSFVIGVMSINQYGFESGFTNYDSIKYNSPEYEVYAPGENILSTLPGNRYAFLNGTSMAAPFVSGIAALLRSYFTDRDMYPSKYIAAQICSTSEGEPVCIHEPHNLPNIVDAYSCLTKLPKPELYISSDDCLLFDSSSISEANNGDGIIDAGEVVDLSVTLCNRWGMSKDTTISADVIGDLGMANPYVTFIKDTVDFGEVGTYTFKDNLTRDKSGYITGVGDTIRFKISEDCPNDYYIIIYLNITCHNALDETDMTLYGYDSIKDVYYWRYLIIFSVRNGVILPSQITEDMTLTKDNYYIIPNLTYILDDVTVNVEPGTKIQFWSSDPSDPYANVGISILIVMGEFICNGTADEMVELFPSDMRSRYAVCFGGGQKRIELHYTKVVNPDISADLIDHCLFTQNYTGSILERYIIEDPDEGLVIFESEERTSVGALYCSNTIFYKTEGCHDGVFENCIFYDSRIFDSSGDVRNSLFIGCKGACRVEREQFVNSAILNCINRESHGVWDLDIYHPQNGWLTFFGCGDLSGNYWGTTDRDLIELQVFDSDDYQILDDIVVDEILTTPPEDVYPFVTNVSLFNSAGEEVRTVSNETVKFVVEFNRDMDVTDPLRVRFGSSTPYAEYEIPGDYVSPRRWEGTYTLKTTIENGRQFFNITGGRADSDHFLKLYETQARWSFDIDTTAAQALIMQGFATDTGVLLTWEQDDFDTLAGYNVYRSEAEDGFYQRLNPYVIPADEKTFFDDTVEPGKVYYYNFTVVQTGLEESTPSGKIVIMSKDTMAPNIYHTPVRTAYTGNNLVVAASVVDNYMISSVTLYFRAVGETAWHTVSMSALNGRYTGIIAADYISLDGLEYYIDAFDGVSHTYKGTAESPLIVTVKLAVDSNSLGDVDGDGVITSKDALMLLKAANDLLNLTEDQFMRADINGDKILSAAEGMRILDYVTGRVTTIV